MTPAEPGPPGPTTQHCFQHRGRQFRLELSADGTLSLFCGGVLRKTRAAGPEPLYVWTNVELEWEEHHYVEVRCWPSGGHLTIAINRQPVYAGPFETAR